MAVLSGGDKLQAALEEIVGKLRTSGEVQVGFFPDATYPDGQYVANIAAIQEFGGRIEREPSTATIYRKLTASGDFAKNGRFVKRSQSNFESTHYVGAYVITIPPRPFFRTTIREKAKEWGGRMASELVRKKYDAHATLDAVGQTMASDVSTTMLEWTDPANAASTIRKKGFNDPLVDSGDMYRAVKHVVKS